MLDNLRRSLSAPLTFATLLAGWCLPGAGAGIWTIFVLGALSFPTLLAFFTGLLPERRGIAKRSFARGVVADLGLGLAQTAMRVAFLAHAAWMRLDAIARTLWRLAASRRKLLEWTPAAQAHRALDLEPTGFFRRMRSAVGMAIAAALLVAASGGSWLFAAPFLVLWLGSPLLAWWVSLPPRDLGRERFSESDAREFRQLARRTWLYFEKFAGGDNNFLPADNFQETPRPEIARRTSPTNIGLSLLATVSANDLGWIGIAEMTERLEKTFSTLQRFERFRGHLYNWYDTTDLRPLEPRYVSTVDSGNLAGHLIALKQACLDKQSGPMSFDWARDGLEDTLDLLAESARGRSRRAVRTASSARGSSKKSYARRARCCRAFPTSRSHGPNAWRPSRSIPRLWSTSFGPSATRTRPRTARPWSGRWR